MYIYHIKFKQNNDEGYQIHIINDDENGIIKEITCEMFMHAGKEELRVRVEIPGETDEMRRMFHVIPQCIKTLKNDVEMLDTLYKGHANITTNIHELFKVIQQIDPLPLSAFAEISALSKDYDLSPLLTHGLIKKAVEAGDHAQALKLALEADTNGDIDALLILANLYQGAGDLANYNIVLANFPKTHHDFANVNEILCENLLSIEEPNNPEEKIYHVEQLFKYSLNAERWRLAASYYDILCGNNGMSPEIKDIKGDPDTLIHIAKVQRRMKNENDALKAYKARNEAYRAAEVRRESEQRKSTSVKTESEKDSKKSNSIGIFKK